MAIGTSLLIGVLGELERSELKWYEMKNMTWNEVNELKNELKKWNGMKKLKCWNWNEWMNEMKEWKSEQMTEKIYEQNEWMNS